MASGHLALRSGRHAAEAVPYLSPPNMLRVTFGARLLDGHVHRRSIYLVSTHCTPRCAVKSEKKKLNFRWQMYLACWNTPIIIAVLFFLLLCVALLYGTSFSSPPVKVLKNHLWRLFLLFSFSHSVYLDLIYVFLLCMRTNAMFRIVYSIPLYSRAWSDSRCLQWYTPCSPFGTCCLHDTGLRS